MKKYPAVFVSDAKYRRYVDIAASTMRGCEVKVIDADDSSLLARFSGIAPYHSSYATYLKLLLPELLPDYDWILYIDGDTLGLGDVSEIFAEIDDSRLIVGSRDIPGFNLGPDVEGPWLKERGLAFGPTAICAGVMLMNLKAMREERITEKCLAFLRTYGTPPLADQTVLNYICRGRISELSPRWGVFSMCPEGVDFSKAAIVHFPADVPWRRDKLNKLNHDFVALWYAAQGKKCGGWRRWLFLLLKHCTLLVTWSPYLKNHLRPLTGI